MSTSEQYGSHELIFCRGSLSEREAASVLKVVLQVIQHCHRNGVVHRDVKPENFLLKVTVVRNLPDVYCTLVSKDSKGPVSQR